MAKQTLNNGDALLDIRTNINSNFTELYDASHDVVTVQDTNTLDLIVTGQEIQGNTLGVKDTNTVTGLTYLKFYKCTQAEYDAIATKDSNTVYIIV